MVARPCGGHLAGALGVVILLGSAQPAVPALASREIVAFVDKHCTGCHNSEDFDGRLAGLEMA
jgi:hypothetical protein